MIGRSNPDWLRADPLADVFAAESIRAAMDDFLEEEAPAAPPPRAPGELTHTHSGGERRTRVRKVDANVGANGGQSPSASGLGSSASAAAAHTSHTAAANSSAVASIPTLPLAETLPVFVDGLPDIHAASFQCPLCCKRLACKTLSPRLLHVSQCALANGLDMEKQVRPLFIMRDAEWVEWQRAHLGAKPKAAKSVQASPTSLLSPTCEAAATAKPAASIPTTAAKPRKSRAKSVQASKPLSLDAALGATRAGSGVGTALSHIKQAKKRASVASVSLSTTAKDNEWEVANGVFLLGEQFLIPNPPPTVNSVAQLQNLAEESVNIPTNPSAPALSLAATASAPPATSSTASQLYSWRHYIHETDLFLRRVLEKRRWALLKYRLLQERLEHEGGCISSLQLDPVAESHELSCLIEEQIQEPTAAEAVDSRSSMWALGASASPFIPSAAFLRELPLNNRRCSLNQPNAPPSAKPSRVASAPTPATVSMLQESANSAQAIFSGSVSGAFLSQVPNMVLPASSSGGKQHLHSHPGFAMLPPPSPVACTQPVLAPGITSAASALPPAAPAASTNIWLRAKALSSPAAVNGTTPTLPVPSVSVLLTDVPSRLVLAEPQLRATTPEHFASVPSSLPAAQPTHSDASPSSIPADVPVLSSTVSLSVHIPSTTEDIAAGASSKALPLSSSLLSPLPLPLPPPPAEDEDHDAMVQEEMHVGEVLVDSNSGPGKAPAAVSPSPHPDASVRARDVSASIELDPPPFTNASCVTSEDYEASRCFDMDHVMSHEALAVGAEVNYSSFSSAAATAASCAASSLQTATQTPMQPTLQQPLFTAESLLAEEEEGGKDPADHDSAFSLSQPSLVPSQSSQPGLQQVCTYVVADVSPQSDNAGPTPLIEQEERKEHEESYLNITSTPSKASPAVATSNTAPFPTARAIIELLSDDDDVVSRVRRAITAEVDLTQRSSPAQGERKCDDPSKDEDDLTVEDLLTECQAKPALSRPHSLTYQAQVARAASAIAAAAPVPQEWKPASARKPWRGASSAEAATAAAVAASQIIKTHSPRVFTAVAAASSPSAVKLPPFGHGSIASLVSSAAASIDVVAAPTPKRARLNSAPASPAPAVAAVGTSPVVAAAASPVGASRCAFKVASPSSIHASFGRCCLPSFDRVDYFSLEDLRDVMAAFGLKTTAKSRHQIVHKLGDMWVAMAAQNGVSLALAANANDASSGPAQGDAAKKKRKKPTAVTAGSPARLPAAPAVVAAARSSPTAPPSQQSPLVDITAAAANTFPTAATPAVKRRKAGESAPAIAAVVHDTPAMAPNLSTFSFPPSPFVSPAIASALRCYLRSQRDLHARILLFQPIDVSELWICIKAAGIDCKIMQLRSFLDAEGISNTLKDPSKSGKGGEGDGGGERKKGSAHVPKGRFKGR